VCLDAVWSALTPHTALLGAAEGHGLMRLDTIVDEAHASIELFCRNTLTSGDVPCKHPRAKPVDSVIGDADGICLILID
jgi:hypothetical protein